MTSDRRRLMMACFGPLTPPAPNYFYVQDEGGAGGAVWFGTRNTKSIDIEYSTDLETWVSEPNIAPTTRITLPAGGRVYLRGSNTSLGGGNTFRSLQCDVDHSIGGSLEFLLDPSGVPSAADNETFQNFLHPYNAANTTLVDASNLTLGVVLSTISTYRAMFRGCTALQRGPFINMATMPARAFQEAFDGCSSLMELKCNATNISASFATTSWMQNVSATGTFYKAASMTSWPRNINGIPAGWTVMDL